MSYTGGFEILFVVFVIVIAGLGVFSYFSSRKARILRKFRKTPGKKMKDVQNGDVVRMIGRIHYVGKPTIAPLSDRECAYYYVLVERKQSSGKSSHWVDLVEEEKSANFLIHDGEHVAYIADKSVETLFVMDRNYASGFMNDATPKLEAYLKEHDEESVGILGFNRTIRYTEGVFEQNERVGVFGTCTWEPATDHGLPEALGNIIVVRSTAEEPVYLSDDSRTMRLFNNKAKVHKKPLVQKKSDYQRDESGYLR